MGVGISLLPSISLAAHISPAFAPGTLARGAGKKPLAARLNSHPVLHSWRCGGDLFLMSQDWLQSTQLCSPSHCRCGPLCWKCSFWRDFELVSVACQKNGLTTELLTEKRGRRRNREDSLICLGLFGDDIEKTNNFL